MQRPFHDPHRRLGDFSRRIFGVNSPQAFKDGDVRFMICTDVAARGLDIKELPFVINVTLPDKARAPRLYTRRRMHVDRYIHSSICVHAMVGTASAETYSFTIIYSCDYLRGVQEEDYVHRIGRVGRAETMGLAVSLVSAHKEKVPNYYVKIAE